MRAIIIAAGRGKRLKNFTENKPKCLVEVEGRTILDRMIDAFRACGIDEICVIRGYKSELINRKGLIYRHNPEWQKNNILLSLSYAHDLLFGDVIVSYSDLLVKPSSIKPIAEAEMSVPFLLQVDTAFAEYYNGRTEHPIEEAESVIYDKNTLKILEIGKKIPHKERTMGEFTGIWRLSDEGCQIWKNAFEETKKRFWGKPFVYAKTFEKAYLTDLMMYLISQGVEFKALLGKHQVMEIDTVQDLMRATKFLLEWERK